MERNVLEIDLGALAHNLDVLREMTGPGVRVAAVVKADAYGHGLVPVSRTLAAHGADALAVFDLEEAAALREAGLALPILGLSGILPEEADEAVRNGVAMAVYDRDAALALSEAWRHAGRTGDVLVKVDTGMSRLGVLPRDIPDFLDYLGRLKSLRVGGLISHLAASESPENPHTRWQMEVFHKTAESLGVNPAHCQISNSGGILSGLNNGCGMVRPGIALYGSPPAAGMPGAGRLRPVMTFKTRVLSVKTAPPGAAVSYGMTHVTRRETVLAAIPAGYDDGFFRRLSNKGAALVRGRRAPVLGMVCMNLTLLDVTDIPGVRPGDEAVILGRQGDERITAEEIASLAGTLNYEVYCAFGRANARKYING